MKWSIVTNDFCFVPVLSYQKFDFGYRSIINEEYLLSQSRRLWLLQTLSVYVCVCVCLCRFYGLYVRRYGLDFEET